jgi:hypothetical protein
MNAGAGSRRLSVETKVIIGFSLVALLVHLLTNQRYGYFRDELYLSPAPAISTSATSISRRFRPCCYASS